MVLQKRAGRESSTMSAGADLILDAALKEAGHDRFDHEAIAGVVADLTLHAPPPINIALFGPWGSGKSSFFGLLSERLTASGRSVKVARYDAWKYGGRALKKHFVGSVADQLGFGGDDFERGLAHDQEVVRFDLWTWFTQNKRSLLVGAVLACAITAVWFLLISGAVFVVNREAGFSAAMDTAVKSVGPVLSLTFAALLFGPKVLESAVVKVTNSAPETDDEFAKSFQRLVDKAIKANKGERLVVFIDELDRCSPADVVATLIDLKTFLDMNGCVFIVAADREVLERALREVPQANPVRDEDPYYSTPGAFIDKVFQHQIPLPPLRAQALTRFARELVEPQSGLWADLRNAQEEDRLFLRVVYGLVPVHVRSPRRVKVLLNNYATNVRIAQARGVDWISRAEELAALTVLETEFPSVAADLVRFPSLLKYLRDVNAAPLSESARVTVDSYRSLLNETKANGADKPETPVAGELLVDAQHDRSASRRANKTLVENLLAYLRKIEASGIDDPRPDLLYLQSAGAREGIDDPDLAEVIDFAADYSATDVVEKFADQSSAVVATAVRLLAQQADAERGPGRMSITESVCRLTERLDSADAQAVAPLVAGTVLAEATNPDWPAEATPGALILGVIGASKPLVETLLANQDAEAMAEAGVLARVSSVLSYASEDQAALVHTLLGSVYYLHPDPLHRALTTTPPAVALSLWTNTADEVRAALGEMVKPPPAPPATTAAARAAAAAATADQTVRPGDTAVERYAALLTAVENRTDDRSERLISEVLRFGQEAEDTGVGEVASDRAELTIDRITTPALRNLHAMLGLLHSPIGEASWWARLLTEAEAAPNGYEVFEHLVDALKDSDETESVDIATAVRAVIPHVPEDEVAAAAHWIGVTLRKTQWTAAAGTALRQNRESIYAIAEALRPRLGPDSGEELNEALAQDLVTALDVSSDAGHLDEVLGLAKQVPASVATEVERLVAERATTAVATVSTLRLRLAAAARGSGGAITAADVLAAKGDVGAREAFAEWLALRPPLDEAQQVFEFLPITIGTLDTYASELSIGDRTVLWIGFDASTVVWTRPAFAAIGKHGLGSAAVDHVAASVATASQQSQRDSRIDRLETAKLIEQPPHKAATDLVMHLLHTGVGGDVSLAARVAILSGGAVRGRTPEVRAAFDAALAAKPKALGKGQRQSLQAINLLSKPPKRRGLRGLLPG